MNKRSMRILGFYQIQHMLVRLAPSRLSKEIARRLKPMSDAEAIDRQLTTRKKPSAARRQRPARLLAASSTSGRLWKKPSAK